MLSIMLHEFILFCNNPKKQLLFNLICVKTGNIIRDRVEILKQIWFWINFLSHKILLSFLYHLPMSKNLGGPNKKYKQKFSKAKKTSLANGVSFPHQQLVMQSVVASSLFLSRSLRRLPSLPTAPWLCTGERVPIINAMPRDVFTQGRKPNINITRRKVSRHFGEALQAGRLSSKINRHLHVLNRGWWESLFL